MSATATAPAPQKFRGRPLKDRTLKSCAAYKVERMKAVRLAYYEQYMELQGASAFEGEENEDQFYEAIEAARKVCEAALANRNKPY